jgi:hypothetical protein
MRLKKRLLFLLSKRDLHKKPQLRLLVLLKKIDLDLKLKLRLLNKKRLALLRSLVILLVQALCLVLITNSIQMQFRQFCQ